MPVYIGGNTGSSLTHRDEVLTQISVGFVNDAMVGGRILPRVGVTKQSDKYNVFTDHSAWLPETDYRAPGTDANEIPGITFSEDTYYCQEHALKIGVTDQERKNTDSPLSPDRDATELVTSKIMMGREKAIKDLVMTPGNFESANTVALTDTTTGWDAYASATSLPITNIKAGNRVIRKALFQPPTLAVIPWQVLSYLEDHPTLIERIKYSQKAVLSAELIAQLIGIQGEVIVPGLGIATNAPGQPDTIAYLWGDSVLLAHVPARPGQRIEAFGYEFEWESQYVKRWREESKGRDVIQAQRSYDLKLVSKGATGKAKAGYLITNTLATANE